MAAAGRTVEHLTVGTPVEVWNNFESSFTAGFEISGGVQDSYLIRRTSDGVELPATFASDDVREASHRT